MREIEPSTPEGAEAARNYITRSEKAGDWDYEYQARLILPHKPEVVWEVLLETENLGLWLDGRERDDIRLPETFGPGFQICGSREQPSYVVDCQFKPAAQSATLVIERPFYVDWPPCYFRFSLSPHERYSTLLTVHVTDSRKPTSFQLFIRSILNKEMYVQTRRELAIYIEEALIRFSHLCGDRVLYGPVLIGYQAKKSWLEWHYVEGIVNYYPNRDGVYPQIGELVQHNERIGFVCPEGTAVSDLHKWKENSYLAPGRGFIRAILKKHGDKITRGERLLLLSEEADTDLGEGLISVAEKHILPQESIYRMRLIDFLPKEGQTIKYGDTVAIFEDSGARFELKSRYSGILTRQLLKVGADAGIGDSIAAVRVDRIGGAEI